MNYLLLPAFRGEELRAVAVAGTVEALAHEVVNTSVTMNIVFHLEATEVVAVHYDELLAAAVVLGHDVVALAGLTVSLFGHLDSLTESEARFEFSKDIHIIEFIRMWRQILVSVGHGYISSEQE